METSKTKTNILPEKNWELATKLSTDVNNQIEDYRKNALDLIAFQHIREELEKFNDWNYIFIIHQTIEQNANNIMQSPYFSRIWLVWTSLIANLDTIINTCYFLDYWVNSAPNFQKHRWSNSLVIMIIKKSQFRNYRNLNDIDSKLLDYVEWWEIKQWWLPNNCIWWYINWISYHKNHNFTWKIWHWI